MATSVMLDLETLGTSPDCVILSIGAIKFDPYTFKDPHSEFYMKLNVDEQIDMGRSIDESTIMWWSKQESSIQEDAFSESDRKSIDFFVKELNRYCVAVDDFWCQGPTFDFVILENLYRQLERPTPWQYWQIRDSRTVFKMMPIDPRKAIQESAHNALADCYYQAVSVQKSYKHFGIRRR